MQATSESRMTAAHQEILDPVKAIENDREFKAHIYQQLVELQPFLQTDSQISVLVQLEANRAETNQESVLESEGEPTVVLCLVATMGDLRLESEGRNNDIYEAFHLAKLGMIQELEDYHDSSVDSLDRESKIQSLLSGANTIH